MRQGIHDYESRLGGVGLAYVLVLQGRQMVPVCAAKNSALHFLLPQIRLG